VNLALALIKQKGIVEAESDLLATIQQSPNDAQAYMALGVVRNKAGKNADAIAAFRRAVELQPDSSDAHLNLGMALVLQFDRKDGLSELREAVRLSPDSAAAHLSLGHFYFETAQYDDARKELEIATRLQPTLEDGFYFWALTERQTNNFKAAAELLRKAIRLNPNNAATQILLGQNLEKLGRTAEAIEHWKQALRIDPNQSQALYNLARSLSRAHDPEAQRYQNRLLELENREQLTDEVELLRSFALQAGKAENWPQAVEQLQQALQLCGDCKEAAVLHKNLAFFYEQTGKLTEAEVELEKTLALDPQDTKAQQGLAQLHSLTGSAP
jgi:tetratricopeptide (TPR) repeat protein